MIFQINNVIFERGSFGRWPRINGQPVNDQTFLMVLQAIWMGA